MLSNDKLNIGLIFKLCYMGKNLTGFLKPSKQKIIVFILLSFFLGFYVNDSFCAAGLFFAFCEKKYGFPLTTYAVSNSQKPDFLKRDNPVANYAGYEIKYRNITVYPALLLINLALYYLILCIVFYSRQNPKPRNF